MKPFIIPTILLDPWDDLEDIVSSSTEETTGSGDDFTTPPDEF